MVHVLLAPGTEDNLERSIVRAVRFTDEDLRVLLTDEQLRELRAMHPSGEACFWGAIASHAKKMSRLASGDPILFKGSKRIRAFGEVGYLFENAAFADAVWGGNGDGKSFTYVYSVRGVRLMNRPIDDLRSLPGFNPNDVVQSQRFLLDDQAERVIEAFGIQASAIEAETIRRLDEMATTLDGTRRVSREARHTSTFNARTVATDALRHRVEAELVDDYCAAMPGRAFGSFLTSRGRRVDLFFHGEGRSEIIEAKSSPDHDKVRESVAQLLDYAPWSPEPVTHLTALFPGPPEQDGVRFLHRLGIDCLYRTGDGRYQREEASARRRAQMYPIWRGR